MHIYHLNKEVYKFKSKKSLKKEFFYNLECIYINLFFYQYILEFLFQYCLPQKIIKLSKILFFNTKLLLAH